MLQVSKKCCNADKMAYFKDLASKSIKVPRAILIKFVFIILYSVDLIIEGSLLFDPLKSVRSRSNCNYFNIGYCNSYSLN